MPYEISQRSARGVEGYLAADVQLWCLYAAVAVIICGVFWIIGAIQWLRRRNRIAVLITAVAFVLSAALNLWMTSRFPDM
jgi:hypothetical protein